MSAMASPVRSRYHGAQEALTTVLREHVTSKTSVKYGERPADLLHKPSLKTHRGLLVALRTLQGNMSFPQKAMEASLRQLEFDDLQAEQKGEFATVVAKRIRLMCAHCHAALSKATTPKWARELFDTATTSAPTAPSASTTTTTAPAPTATDAAKKQYMVGWDAEQDMAWRKLPGISKKEYSRDIKPGDEDHHPCRATWPDGFQHEACRTH